MKYLIYTILLAITTTSCNWIVKPTPDEAILLEEELSKINWEQVDEQAGLVFCDSLSNNEEKAKCMHETLQKTIQENLSNTIIETTDLQVDTILVALIIDVDSTITLIPDFNQITNTETQERILQTINTISPNLPKAYPAIKRGIPTKTQINMPLAFIK
jgi:phosphoribosylformylglycinamidine (FGAM) synthase PurS component